MCVLPYQCSSVFISVHPWSYCRFQVHLDWFGFRVSGFFRPSTFGLRISSPTARLSRFLARGCFSFFGLHRLLFQHVSEIAEFGVALLEPFLRRHRLKQL
jgi:hypothetical protein